MEDPRPGPGADHPARLSPRAIVRTLAASRRESSTIELKGPIRGVRFEARRGQGRWVLHQRTRTGARRKIALGPWPQVSIEEAAIRGQAAKRWFKGKLTLGDVLARYDADVLAAAPSGRPRLRSLTLLMAPLLEQKISRIGQKDLMRCYDEIAARAPVHANRALAYARAFLAWASEEGLAAENPLAEFRNPAYEPKRFTVLGYDELGEVFAAAQSLGYPFGPVIRLLILTLATRQQVASMRRGDLDDALTLWTLPQRLDDQALALQIPLPQAGRRELQLALCHAPSGSDLIFTTNGLTAVSGWSKAKRRLDGLIWARRLARYGERAQRIDWRLQDIRRSFVTFQAGRPGKDPTVERCLGRIASIPLADRSWFFGEGALEIHRDMLDRWADDILSEAATWAEG